MADFKHTVLGARATFSEAANAETNGPDEEQAEALALVMVAGKDGQVTNGVEFTYSATAEDRGVPGELDLQPGIIYTGPAGMFTSCKVKVLDVDVSEGAIAVPDDEDTCTIGLYVNSALWSIADEGFASVESFDVETVVEFNIVATDLVLTEYDVIRVAIVGVEANEELLDWDVDTTGTLEIQ